MEERDITVSLINRIRWSLNLAESSTAGLDELVATLTDEGFASEEIFLAYHAAVILEGDYK